MKKHVILPLVGAVMSAALSAQAVPEAPLDNNTDVLVVGGGGAGMGAAIAAREVGADVILLEKLAMIGGTTLLSSTAFNAGGSSVQMAMNKPYTADDYYKKLTSGAGGRELENLRQLANASGPTTDWLLEMGADLTRVINGSQHTPKDGSALGVSLVPTMKKRVDALGSTRDSAPKPNLS